MTPRALITLVLGLLLVLATACGDGDGGTCTSSSDCAGTEECVWVKEGGSVKGQSCVVKCSTDTDCKPQRCLGQGTSCPSCTNYIAFCK